MELTDGHCEYWSRNLRMTALLLAIWFVVTFVVAFFARDAVIINFFGVPLTFNFNFNFFGWPFSFWMGAQGSLIVYVIIIWYYARYMNNLDHEYGVDEEEQE